MYNKIVNPLTNRKVVIQSKLGQLILKNYLNNLKGGTKYDYVAKNCITSSITLKPDSKGAFQEEIIVPSFTIMEKLEKIKSNINNYNNLVIIYGGSCTIQDGGDFLYDGFKECQELRKLTIQKAHYKTLTIIIDPQKDEGLTNKDIVHINYLHPTNNECFLNIYIHEFIEKIIEKNGLVVIIDAMRIYMNQDMDQSILTNIYKPYEKYYDSNMLIIRQFFNNVRINFVPWLMWEEKFTKEYSPDFSYIEERLGNYPNPKNKKTIKLLYEANRLNKLDDLVKFKDILENRIDLRLKH